VIQIHVDMSRCQHYGQCVFEAPNVFQLNAQDRLQWKATADDSELSNIEAAIDICPMQAISLAE
jgi:ferredoxin